MATEEEGLGGLAKRWLRAKKTELLTGNRREREYAETEAANAQRDAGDRMAAEAMYQAFPGLARARDRQQAARDQRDADARAEILGLPRYRVEANVTGAFTGSVTGPLPCRIERDAGDPAEDEPATLTVSLETPEDGEGALILAGQPLYGLRLVLRPYRGPGEYRIADNAEADPLDCSLDLSSREEGFYWAGDDAPGSVIVGSDEKSFDVVLAMAGAGGDVLLRALLTPA